MIDCAQLETYEIQSFQLAKPCIIMTVIDELRGTFEIYQLKSFKCFTARCYHHYFQLSKKAIKNNVQHSILSYVIACVYFYEN